MTYFVADLDPRCMPRIGPVNPRAGPRGPIIGS